MDDAILAELESFYHLDPWWQLTAERYQGLDSILILKTANCVDELPANTPGVYIRGNLDRHLTACTASKRMKTTH